MNSLGFEKPRRMTRAIVALSGGVDSAAVAALLVHEGYDVVGVTMLLHDAAEQSVADARAIADALHIQHHVLDLRQRFQTCVVERFAEDYACGRTPNPCTTCNQQIKFGDLFVAARELGGDVLATGHYARLALAEYKDAILPHLLAGADEWRDQSYFLFGILRENLPYIRFPLGDKTKDEARKLASQLGLDFIAKKKDSQDVCFAPDGKHADIVAALRPDAAKPGAIVDQHGRELGRHAGIMNFTIGQRRGLDLGLRHGDNNEPLYVVALRADQAQVVVGPRSSLAKTIVTIRDVNWLADDIDPFVKDGIEIKAKLRSTQKHISARYKGLPNGEGCIELLEPVEGIATGQAGVIYLNDRVLGGGWIETAI